MQPLGRCPRCGYPLTYDGRVYRCDYCGYPRTHQPQQPLMASLRNLERNLRSKAQNILEGGRRDQYQRMIVQNPYTSGHQFCGSCGLTIPYGVQTCPYCGTPQRPPQRAPQTNSQQGTNPVGPQVGDQRVLDYISAHNGTISISQTAKELSMSPEMLRSTIERLKSAGFLKPT